MDLLFHGTAGDFSAPTVSRYDGLFWTALDSAIAQTYIPVSRGKTCITVFMYEMKNRVVPCRPGVSPLWDIATLIQPELLGSVHATYDQGGHATSYSISDAHPCIGDMCVAIENIFGYRPSDPVNPLSRSYTLHIERIDELGRSLYASAAWKLPGFLWIIQAPDSLKLYNMAGESSGDLTDPQYHKVDRFRAILDAGYDGVIIDDFTASPTWGSVGHSSYGFFARSLAKLSMSRIPASNFDWGPLPIDFPGSLQSPEFKNWLSNQRKAA